MEDFWRSVDWEADWEAETTEGDQVEKPMDLEMAMTGDKSRGMGCVLDFIEENPIGLTIFLASLSPPPLAGGAPSGSGWVLLESKAYIAAGCTNETTAKDFTRAGHEIQATLRVARPPLVSHLCVDCPTLKPSDFGTEPVILAACDGFIFFRAAICNSYHCYEPVMQDFFVYRAPLSRVHGQPSLTRLPQPDFSAFARCDVGIVRCNDGGGDDDDSSLTLRAHCLPHQHYVVAGLRVSQGTSGDYTQYDLHRLDSREGKWTTQLLQLGPMAPSSPGLSFFYHMTHKVVTLGGGVMGWVDLCRGILLCDVLADRPQLRYIPLPEPGKQEQLSETSANVFRDVAVVQGGLRCVEHQTQVRPWSDRNGTYISDDWTVTTWSWKITNPSSASAWEEGRWERDCKIDASHINGSLPKLLGQAASLPPLQHLHTGHPTLSLDDNDVVYLVAKVDHRDNKAFVIAVNVRDGVLQAAENFGAERMVGIDFTYTQYRPSAYPAITLGKMGKLASITKD